MARALDAPEIRWAVPGLIPDGLTLLAGPSKAGKSFMCLDIAVAVATGASALGHLVAEEGDVLYVAAEDIPRRLRERMLMLVGHEENFPWDTLTLVPQPIPGSPAMLAKEWVETARNPRLLIIDTKARALDPFRQENRFDKRSGYNVDYDSMSRLHDFANQHGFSLLVVTHTNQMRLEAGEDWFVKIQGTTGIPGVADGVILLDAKRGDPEGTLRVAGRDIPDNDMTVRRVGPWWQITDGEPRGRLGDRSVAIRDYVYERGEPVSNTDIAEKFGMSAKSVATYMNKLKGTQVQHLGRGLWGPLPK